MTFINFKIYLSNSNIIFKCSSRILPPKLLKSLYIQFFTIFGKSNPGFILIIHFWKPGVRVVFFKQSHYLKETTLRIFFPWHNTWSKLSSSWDTQHFREISRRVRISRKVQHSLEDCSPNISPCWKQEIELSHGAFCFISFWPFCTEVQIKYLYSSM